MDPRVTAIVVTRNGGDRLGRTLLALAEQSRAPEAIIAIDCASSDRTAAILAEFGPTHLISVPERLPFGSAVATAVRVLPPATSEHDWLWLLAQDTAPDPDALRLLLATVEVSPSVAVAGPKQVDWDDPTFIRELGEAITPLGASVALVEDELDQAQHDGRSDVLAVGAAGMLVRQSVWERLGGFDPGLPSVDDGLDFCLRARLAGYRVTMVPSASVATAGDGIAGPPRSKRTTVRIRLERERRQAQLHRRLAYAPSAVLWIHWLSLVPLAVLRAIGRLVGKAPGLIGGELSAAFRVAFSGLRVGAARRNIARNRQAGWAAIAPLRIPLSEVRRSRAQKRDLARSAIRGETRSLDFFQAGGAWVVLLMLLVGVGLFFALLNAPTIAGGGLLPLSETIGRVWQNAAYGWRDIGLGFTGASDPFTAVLAVVGSLMFWQPSSALVILYFAALPVSAMGAWLLAARLTDRRGPRAFAGIAWALSPALLAAMQTGRPAAIIAHILLPWLFFAGLAASRSWASAATTALLAAAICACAPSLAPALVVIWAVSLVIARRRAGRLLFLPVPALALFAPLIWQQGARGAWLSLLADPGVPQATAAVHPWWFVLGTPDAAVTGWAPLLSGLGLPPIVTGLVIPVLLIPIAALAVLSLFLRGSARAAAALAVALLGFATAVGASGVAVAVSGPHSIGLWPGSGLSLYWLGVVVAATIALSTLGTFTTAPVWISSLALAVAVVPVALALPLGHAMVHTGTGQTLPAVITADAATHPRVGTLVVTPEKDGAAAVRLVRGDGVTLDAQSTLDSTSRGLSAGDRSLARLTGNLLSQSGMDERDELNRLGIGFVLLAPDRGSPAAQQLAERGQSALDENPLLTSIGATPNGQVWSYLSGRGPTPPAAEVPPHAGEPVATIVTLGQIVVIALTLLLAIPIGGAPVRPGPIVPSAPPVRRRRSRARRAGPEEAMGARPADQPEASPPASEAEAGAGSTGAGAGATGSDAGRDPAAETDPPASPETDPLASPETDPLGSPATTPAASPEAGRGTGGDAERGTNGHADPEADAADLGEGAAAPALAQPRGDADGR